MQLRGYWEDAGRRYLEKCTRIPWGGPHVKRYTRYTQKKALQKVSDLLCGESVLEVGCGDGYWFNHYREWHAADVCGVDISRSILLPARAERVVQASATALPFRSGAFDVVITVTALEHLPSITDLIRSLEEVRRVLRKDDGYALFLELSVPYATSWFSPLLSLSRGEWVALVEDKGFTLDSMHPVDPSVTMFLLDLIACKTAGVIGRRCGGWLKRASSRSFRLAGLYYLMKDALAIPAQPLTGINKRLCPSLSASWLYVFTAGDSEHAS